eukprot:1161208-Pelagomonas_calceolata.AAC.1
MKQSGQNRLHHHTKASRGHKSRILHTRSPLWRWHYVSWAVKGKQGNLEREDNNSRTEQLTRSGAEGLLLLCDVAHGKMAKQCNMWHLPWLLLTEKGLLQLQCCLPTHEAPLVRWRQRLWSLAALQPAEQFSTSPALQPAGQPSAGNVLQPPRQPSAGNAFQPAGQPSGEPALSSAAL